MGRIVLDFGYRLWNTHFDQGVQFHVVAKEHWWPSKRAQHEIGAARKLLADTRDPLTHLLTVIFGAVIFRTKRSREEVWLIAEFICHDKCRVEVRRKGNCFIHCKWQAACGMLRINRGRERSILRTIAKVQPKNYSASQWHIVGDDIKESLVKGDMQSFRLFRVGRIRV